MLFGKEIKPNNVKMNTQSFNINTKIEEISQDNELNNNIHSKTMGMNYNNTICFNKNANITNPTHNNI